MLATNAEGGARKAPGADQGRGTETIQAIINIAEKLWSERGIEGASLREIVKQAGCANKSAVNYHFGDRDGLINAVFAQRIPAIEHRRLSLLLQAEADGQLEDTGALLTILYRPLFEVRDSEGHHTYAAFVRSVTRYRGFESVVARQLTPSAYRVIDLIRTGAGRLPDGEFEARARLINELCLSAIVDQDYLDENDRDARLAEKVLADAISSSSHLLHLPA